MTARRDIVLAKPELELKVATRALVRAAGGTDGAGESIRDAGLGKSRLQQRMSDCQNRNTPDFLRIDEVGAIEDVTSGEGWPHVTRALARRQGFVLVPVAQDESDPDGLLMSVSEITAELGDVAQAITSALRHCSEGGRDCTPAEAAGALDQLHDLERGAARLRVKLQALIEKKSG